MQHPEKRILFVVQARMGSSRLPGKVLMPLGDHAVLEVLVERLKRCKFACPQNIVVATTTEKTDDAIAKFCLDRKYKYIRGSETNVLERFVQAIYLFEPDIVVRITADNPLTDPQLLDMLIEKHLENENHYTYIKNAPVGAVGEVVDANKLVQIYELPALEDRYCEHVTLYLTKRPDQFKLEYVDAPKEFAYPQIRLTVDTLEDFALIKEIFHYFQYKMDVNLLVVLSFLNSRPELLQLNANISQKLV